MEITPVPVSDHERLKALNEYSILDALPDADFGDITRIAAAICKTPVSLVSISDAHGQWFKSGHGLEIREIPGNFAGINHISLTDEVFIVPDLSKDDHFSNNPFVTGKPHLAFYALIPLVTPEKYVLGSLCIFDYKPKNLNGEQIETLKSLARQIVSQLELKKKIFLLNQKQVELKRAYADLEKFSYIVSHDLKSPLNNIISLTHLLKDDYGTKLDEEGNEYVTFLNVAAYQLSDLVSGILNYSKSSQLVVENRENINIGGLIKEITSLLNPKANTEINFKKGNKFIYSSRVALKQILLHLLHNASKYNDKDHIIIDVNYYEDTDYYYFEIKDNGPGIAKEDHAKIFELFERLHNKKDGESMGIGLAVVKRLVEKLGGDIKVDSELTKGATFIFTISK